MKISRLAVVGLAALAASFGAEAQTRGTIKIVSHTPLSGSNANLGEAIRNGADLAIRDYGGQIRQKGFNLVFQPVDDQGVASVAVANANRLINDPDVLALVGHLQSGLALPAGEVYHRVGLPSVSPANTSPLLTERGYKEFSRVVGRDDVQGPAAAQYLINVGKYKSFFVINDKTAYGSGIADAFVGEARKLGATVVENAGVAETETDFSAILNRVDAAQPDVVYFGGLYGQGGPLLKQMREKGIDAVFAGADGVDSSEFERLAGAENMKGGVVFTTTSLPLNRFSAGERFGARYQAAFGKAPEAYSLYGYDAATTVIRGILAAINTAGGRKPTRAQVAEAIRKQNFQGLTGRISFNAKGDLEQAAYVVLRIDTDYANRKVVQTLNVKAP